MLCLKSSPLLSCAILLTIIAGASMYVLHPKTHPKIRQHKGIATWEEAKQRCASEGAMLASPISEELLQYMRAIITVNNHTTPYFIGFKARDNMEFRSEEGILLEDVTTVTDIVERIDVMEGDCLCMDGHSIRMVPCWSRLPFMCYTNDTFDIPAITHKRERLQCGPDYKLYSTGCYKLHDQKMNWTDAYWTCAADGAYLVVINDSDEAKVVADIVKGSGDRWCWVGLRDVTRNQDWVAITGERLDQLYRDWLPTAHHDANHPCGFLNNGKLNDWECSGTSHVICEK